MAIVPSKAREYADMNEHKAIDYWLDEDYTVEWVSQEDYRSTLMLGRTKLSTVIEALDRNKKKVVMKMLRPAEHKNVKREIKVLEKLRDGINIVRLLAGTFDAVSKTLIFEYVDVSHHKKLYKQLTGYDIKYYHYELLDFCHSKGIMHRDVEPYNIMIDHEKRRLRLKGWSRAEFYHQGHEAVLQRSRTARRLPDVRLFGGYVVGRVRARGYDLRERAVLFRQERPRPARQDRRGARNRRPRRIFDKVQQRSFRTSGRKCAVA